MCSSVLVLADIPVRSPRILRISIIKCQRFRIKASQKQSNWVRKCNHWCAADARVGRNGRSPAQGASGSTTWNNNTNNDTGRSVLQAQTSRAPNNVTVASRSKAPARLTTCMEQWLAVTGPSMPSNAKILVRFQGESTPSCNQ